MRIINANSRIKKIDKETFWYFCDHVRFGASIKLKRRLVTMQMCIQKEYYHGTNNTCLYTLYICLKSDVRFTHEENCPYGL